MIKKLVLKWSFWASNHSGYKSLKALFQEVMISQQSTKRIWFDSLMVCLVLMSVTVLIIQVRYTLGEWTLWFEVFVVSIFIIEYLIRFWICSDVHEIVVEQMENAQKANVPINWQEIYRLIFLEKWRYISSPLAIIDLLAIVPVYRPLRFLRVFLLFRLFKLFRYSRTISEFAKVLEEKRFELHTLLLFVAIIIMISGAALYVFEGGKDNSQITNLFDAFYWSLVTVSTVGYGDITPVTVEGRVVTMVLIVSGVGVVAFFTSTVVAAFNSKLSEIQDNRILSEIEKLSNYSLICGYGRIGAIVAEKLSKLKKNVVILEENSEKISRARKNGLLALQGDASSSEVLSQLSITEKVEHVVCLTNDDVINLYITLSLRQLNPSVSIIARVNLPENKVKMSTAGATKVISPNEITAIVSREFAGQPVAFDAIRDIMSGSEGIGIETITVNHDSRLIGRSLTDVDCREFKLVLVGIVVDTSVEGQDIFNVGEYKFLFNPDESYSLQENDRLVVVGHYQSAAYFMEYWM
ncbi:NAD-binding protein [Pleionea sediminis]|uniref:NAD-binding protein n=1 Tax=Pleionea sediminis TaxID=2569479 RepID=UPI001186ED01|nr:NAD-binding protein [Pleionea sediminis]